MFELDYKMPREEETDKKVEKKVEKKLEKKKEPLFYFFDLTAQTVKLNSPLLDEVICIDTSSWYDEVMEEHIPYHTWYVWIDKKIH